MKFSRLFFCTALLLASCTSQGVLSDQGNSDESVTIAYAEPISSYSPLSYEAVNRKYLVNIYEPLVRYDSTFNYETGLAVSWGRLDDTHWDFRLRKDVRFHDGSFLDADDVLYSIQMARQQEESQLASLLSTIVSVEKTAEDRLTITTARPDPLLLNKLTYVYIFPSGYENFDIPVGTGPYRVSKFVDDTLVLERFDQYWGALAYFKEARLQYIPDPDARLTAMENGDVDVLANVPPQSVEALESDGIQIKDFPSLEVSFLILNQHGIFADENLRNAVWYGLGNNYVQVFGGGYLLESSQYAASGITGYDPNFEKRQKNLDIAREYRSKAPGELSVTIDVPEGLEVLGQAIQADLQDIDIQAEVNAIPLGEYEDHILLGTSDLYFFGWKYDLADSADFYESVVHTPTETYGTFNGFNYSNTELDSMIEDSSTSLDTSERRALLNQIASMLVEDHAVVPLFEAQVLYGLSPELYYDFRLDGQIWASEIVENVVK